LRDAAVTMFATEGDTESADTGPQSTGVVKLNCSTILTNNEQQYIRIYNELS